LETFLHSKHTLKGRDTVTKARSPPPESLVSVTITADNLHQLWKTASQAKQASLNFR
jgi:hypothetical protein